MPNLTLQTRMVLAAFLKDHDDPDTELYGRQVIHATGLAPGTAYPILNRLEEAGWLISRREGRRGQPSYRPRSRGGPPRRYYALTSEGWAVARQETVKDRADIKRRRAS
jgi:DNA-binding PadR family transcriptional regulator